MKNILKSLSASAFLLGLAATFNCQQISADSNVNAEHQANMSFLEKNQTDYNQVLQIGKNKIVRIKDAASNPSQFGLSTEYGSIGGASQPWNTAIAFNEYYKDSTGKTWFYTGYDVNQDHSVYRLYNPNTGEHFYTTSSTETFHLHDVGWTFEGIGWQSPTDKSQNYTATGASNSLAIKPVYRVYNPNAKGGDHYYTESKYEASHLVDLGWKWDYDGKPVFYTGGDLPIYVAYNPNAASGSHNYTTSLAEQNNLLSLGWKFGSTAMYGG